MDQKHDWEKYGELTKDAPPRPLLVKALAFAKPAGRALDVGGGALNDTRYLLEQGFDVSVVDGSKDIVEKAAAKIQSEKFRYTISTFADFDFPKETYDLVSAMFSLPFNPPETFDAVFQNIKDSVAKGGIFCGNLCGPKDQWHPNPDMTFRTKEEVEASLADMEILSITDREWDGILANGAAKHWHLINFIGKKR
jgi:SAM-dependent methyltransferase